MTTKTITKIHDKYKGLYHEDIREKEVIIFEKDDEHVVMPLVTQRGYQIGYGLLPDPSMAEDFITVDLDHTNYGISRNSPLGKVLNGHSE